MINQFKAENIRLKKRKGIAITALVLFLINLFGAYSQFPRFFETMTVNEALAETIGDTSLFFIVALCVTWFVGAEFSERTVQNELKLGYSRLSVVFVRFIYSCFIASAIHLLSITAIIAGAFMRYGFSLTELNGADFLWLFIVLVQVCALQGFTVLFVFLIRKAAAAMAVSAIFTLITCNLCRNFIKAPVYVYSCFSLAQDNEPKTLWVSFIFALAVLFIVPSVTYLVFRKADME